METKVAELAKLVAGARGRLVEVKSVLGGEGIEAEAAKVVEGEGKELDFLEVVMEELYSAFPTLPGGPGGEVWWERKEDPFLAFTEAHVATEMAFSSCRSLAILLEDLSVSGTLGLEKLSKRFREASDRYAMESCMDEVAAGWGTLRKAPPAEPGERARGEVLRVAKETRSLSLNAIEKTKNALKRLTSDSPDYLDLELESSLRVLRALASQAKRIAKGQDGTPGGSENMLYDRGTWAKPKDDFGASWVALSATEAAKSSAVHLAHVLSEASSTLCDKDLRDDGGEVRVVAGMEQESRKTIEDWAKKRKEALQLLGLPQEAVAGKWRLVSGILGGTPP